MNSGALPLTCNPCSMDSGAPRGQLGRLEALCGPQGGVHLAHGRAVSPEEMARVMAAGDAIERFGMALKGAVNAAPVALARWLANVANSGTGTVTESEDSPTAGDVSTASRDCGDRKWESHYCCPTQECWRRHGGSARLGHHPNAETFHFTFGVPRDSS